ncbi:hypothetical protein HFV04_003350 [Pseudomonas sp. BIGb0427]|uniref:hypothetical protein n=1 Tax=unclassified Pseudomonas TaxID=196821 RepID=UPI00169778D2|nr:MULTISPECIES: hypothetical protein [unclassified Pseudomonas]NLU58570.1 hypothetical protein [Pseudomonas sp. BIGb0427]QPG63823.1 hypothetical protein HFV04_003350 [Pseudomonas sp. BIGb0427]UVM66273.1 hypothetical protein LOY34_23725 [Pseudomonas sp. B21-009]
MTTFATDTNWAQSAEIFLGRVHILDTPEGTENLKGDTGHSVHLSRFNDASGQAISGQSDWLVAGQQKPAYAFRFLFHSRSSDRLHFMITGSGADHDKTVGVSRNGYLGLYKYASVSDYIKIEPLLWSTDTVVCRLRDHLGNIVRTHHDPEAPPRFSYLRVNHGKEVIFHIERVRS